MFLNLKDEKSGWVVGNDGWMASDMRFDGDFDDIEAVEEPFMNCSSLSVIYLNEIFCINEGRGGLNLPTLRLLGGRHTGNLREMLVKDKRRQTRVPRLNIKPRPGKCRESAENSAVAFLCMTR